MAGIQLGPFDTGAYPQRLHDLLAEPIQHLHRVTVQPAGGTAFDVAVDDELQIRFSMGWAPYAQANLVIKTPTNPVQRAALDGRLRTYVRIQTGYMLDGAPVVTDTARLRIQDVDEAAGTGQIGLSLQGREMEAQDATWALEWNAGIPRGGVREAIDYVLQSSINGDVTLTGTGNGHRPDLVAELEGSEGQDLWSMASGIADSAGLKLWHDGLSTWRLQPRYALRSDNFGAALRTGPGGTVTRVQRRQSRSDWYNEVILSFPDSPVYAGGSPRKGIAQTPARSIYGYLNVGRKTYTENVPGWANNTTANNRAAAKLRTLSARGDRYSVTAVAAYWLRPGMTALIKTGTGPYERQLVESVTLSPLTGLMTVDTVKNEDTAA